MDVDTDFESDQVPFELSTLPLQKLQDLICAMLTEIKYFIFIFCQSIVIFYIVF